MKYGSVCSGVEAASLAWEPFGWQPQWFTVDVKATRYKNGRLLAVLWKEKKDVYGLMTGTFPTYEFRGLADGDDLLSADNIVDLGHGPTYALAQEALR